MKNIYLLVGPSGVGKTSVGDVLERTCGWAQISSCTDRPKRTPDEQHHQFLTTEEFCAIKKEDLVAETIFNGYHYGTSAQMVDACDLYAIDPAGVATMRERYHGKKGIRVIALTAPTTVLAQRMRQRGDSEAAITARLAHDAKAFANFEHRADVVITTKTVEQTVAEVERYIRNEENG